MDRPEAETAAARLSSVAVPIRAAPASAEPCHDARVLTGGGVSARILLGDQVYALRITRAGKLILTK